MDRKWLLPASIVAVFCAGVVFPLLLGVPWDSVFASDAVGYSTGAKNLLYSGFYTFDGVHPFLDREPGMSWFLVPIYFLFGVENATALAAVQFVLLFVSTWFFCTRFARIAGQTAAGLCFLLIVSSGSVLHTVFSAYRECFVLSLLLLFSGLYLQPGSRDSSVASVLMGAILGIVILTYYSFVFFPLFLLAAWLRDKRPFKQFVIVCVVMAALVSAWGLRNASYGGGFRIIENRRTAVMWYVRGEQAERIRGMEPFWCLWAEYISRDWNGRSDACSYNGLMNTKWSGGFDLEADYSDVADAGKAKILKHFPWYLWFSVFEVLELHFPYLGYGWSSSYNQYAALTQLLLAVGFLLALPKLADRKYSILTAFIAYNTAVFVFTDATPRYLLPVFFGYAALAGTGYTWLLQALRRSS